MLLRSGLMERSSGLNGLNGLSGLMSPLATVTKAMAHSLTC